MSVTHYYHGYAGDGWRVAWADHVAAIKRSGLHLDEARIGLTGEDRDEVRLMRRQVAEDISQLVEEWTITDHGDGWEQKTLASIQASDDDIVLYTHSKGAGNNHVLNDRWRRYLEKFTLAPWAEAVVTLLDGDVQVICPNWLTVSVTGELPEGCSGFSPGNYWWARGDFLNTLPPLDFTDRYGAEVWIGMGNPVVAVTDPRPWSPDNWTDTGGRDAD